MGKIHSIQSLGTVDGPGVRFVVFFSGCNLRCGCCHNPDTWEMSAGSEISADEVVKKALRCREYFGEEGGITISGGEPLLQPEFARDIFALCKKEGVNTCLDTSGSLLNERIEALLEVTDRVLLDIKFTNNEDYARHAGCSLDSVLCGQQVDYIKYDVEGAEREAIEGSRETITSHRPALLVSAYHKSEDIFALPLQIHALRPDYKLYYRRYPYIPAWDLNLICT